MSLEIMRDPRVRRVEWKDLLHLTPWEIGKEVVFYVPWLVASWILVYFAPSYPLLYAPALACSFIFFLCGLRVVHNAYHYAMGISRPATEWVMFILSVLMLSAMHALQQTHLHHHKHCMDEDDVEAASARMQGWKAILFGPKFYVTIQTKGIELGTPRQRRWILAEYLCMAIWVPSVFLLNVPMLKYHAVAMLVGQCLTAFFAVWTVHHDCDRSHFIARTLRNPLKSLIVFDMFYHLEHHLFPKVPTCHLGKLSKRLDAAAPELQEKQVW
jgi:fatty acid desaturase